MIPLQGDQSTNPVETEICVQLNGCCVVCVSVLQRGQYDEVYMCMLTLCKYDLRKCDLFGPACDECVICSVCRWWLDR